MFSRNKAEAVAITGTPPAKKNVPSIISSDLSILGNLISDGMLDIDGTIEGNIKADHVIIRANGRLKGDMTANAVHVYGEVQGLIRATSVYLYSTCRIEGTVVHQSLSVEDGAFIDGKLKRMQDRVSTSPEQLEYAEEGEEGNDAENEFLTRNNLRLIS